MQVPVVWPPRGLAARPRLGPRRGFSSPKHPWVNGGNPIVQRRICRPSERHGRKTIVRRGNDEGGMYINERLGRRLQSCLARHQLNRLGNITNNLLFLPDEPRQTSCSATSSPPACSP